METRNNQIRLLAHNEAVAIGFEAEARCTNRIRASQMAGGSHPATIKGAGIVSGTLNSMDREEMTMSQTTNQWEQVAGKWKQFSGEVKKQWGKLTDDELMQVNGNRDILAGKLQEKYGIAKEQANKQIDEWASKLKR